jgi:hypothetical protein
MCIHSYVEGVRQSLLMTGCVGSNLMRNLHCGSTHTGVKFDVQFVPFLQFNMAVCCLEGWGIGRHKTKAAKWLREAAKGGDLQAAVLLATLQGSAEASKRKDLNLTQLDNEVSVSMPLSPSTSTTQRNTRFARSAAVSESEPASTGSRRKLSKIAKQKLAPEGNESATTGRSNMLVPLSDIHDNITAAAAFSVTENNMASEALVYGTPRKKARTSSGAKALRSAVNVDVNETTSSSLGDAVAEPPAESGKDNLTQSASGGPTVEHIPQATDTCNVLSDSESNETVRAEHVHGAMPVTLEDVQHEGQIILETPRARGSKTGREKHTKADESVQATSSTYGAQRKNSNSEDATQLSVSDVCERLRLAGFEKYCHAFQESAIDGGMLDDLHELWEHPLGVTNKAHQIKILKIFGKR